MVTPITYFTHFLACIKITANKCYFYLTEAGMTDTLKCPSCEKTYKETQVKAYYTHMERKHGGVKEAKKKREEAEQGDKPAGK